MDICIECNEHWGLLKHQERFSDFKYNKDPFSFPTDAGVIQELEQYQRNSPCVPLDQSHSMTVEEQFCQLVNSSTYGDAHGSHREPF